MVGEGLVGIDGRTCVLPKWMVFDCGKEVLQVSREVVMLLILNVRHKKHERRELD